MIIQLCEIFTIGGIPISDNVRKVCLNAHALQRLSHAQMIKLTASDALQGFTAIHLAAIAATAWILLLNAIVGFQLLDDGTPVSVGLLLASGAILFIGTGYIALDTGFRWTGHFDPSLNGENRNIGLYVLYLLFPLICLVTFFALEAVLVLRILGELRPLCMLTPFPTQLSSCGLRRFLPNCWPRLLCYLSIPQRSRPAFCHWSNFPIRHQYPPLSSIQWEDKRIPLCDSLHRTFCGSNMDILE